jgi:hypothetical protein
MAMTTVGQAATQTSWWYTEAGGSYMLLVGGGGAGSTDDVGGTNTSCEELFGWSFSESARFRTLLAPSSKSAHVKPQASHSFVLARQPYIVPRLVMHLSVHATCMEHGAYLP